MPSCRAFFVWILMLALPMQGLAAASMAICTAFQPAAAVAAMQAEQPAAHAHAGGHDHGSQPTDHGVHADPHAAAHGGDSDSSSHDAGHQCGNCGACHVTGLLDSALPAVLHPLPQGRAIDHLDPMASVAPHLLDKPPRA